jgi:hypothetical protein
MKSSASVFLLLSSLALGSPTPIDNAISERRDISPLNNLAKRDRVCWITAGESEGCDTTPTSGVRHGVLKPGSVNGPTFGVGCWQTGTKVTGNGVTNNIWLYVPANGYQCYVWSGWVDQPCRSKSRVTS